MFEDTKPGDQKL